MKSIVLALALLLGATVQPSDDDLARVMAKFDAYMAAYEPRLSELVADERMDQMVRVGARDLSHGRVLISEVAFIALPDGPRPARRWPPIRTSGNSRPRRGFCRSS